MKFFNKIDLEIRYINEMKGFGVFALEKINSGNIVEICYCISTYNQIINPLVDYLFEISTNDKNIGVLPLGYGSIYNHSDSPNIKWKVNKTNNSFIEFYSLREIESGEELCHSYGENYWNTRKKRMI
jgi:SET domain-containing protein